MPASYEFEYVTSRVDQVKHCWKTKTIHDEYINT